MTLREVVNKATEELKRSGIESYRLDAEVLMEKILSKDRIFLITHPEHEVPDDAAAAFFGCAEERAKGRPLAYIIGEKEFMGLPFAVSESVLIPRPDTETAAEAALQLLGAAGVMGSVELAGAAAESGRLAREAMQGRSFASEERKPRVLDLCTGSGALAVSIAYYAPFAEVVATDLSEEALELAKKNAKANGVGVRFLQGDLFEPVEGEPPFDLIVSNPPYIPSADIEELEVNVKDYEPRMALDGGKTGLDFYEKIVPQAAALLNNGGWLVLEIGYDQAEDLRKIAEASRCYKSFSVLKDLAGLDRVVLLEY